LDFYLEQLSTEAHTQALPTEVAQIETHTQTEELGNTASSQFPPASSLAGPSREGRQGRRRGRPGTGGGGESHVNNSWVSNFPQRGGCRSGRPCGRTVWGEHGRYGGYDVVLASKVTSSMVGHKSVASPNLYGNANTSVFE